MGRGCLCSEGRIVETTDATSGNRYQDEDYRETSSPNKGGMGMDECPFCGAKLDEDFRRFTPTYLCGTEKVQILGIRGNKCLETQLARQSALLERWLKNEINHVFQNSTLQEDTKAALTPRLRREVEGK